MKVGDVVTITTETPDGVEVKVKEEVGVITLISKNKEDYNIRTHFTEFIYDKNQFRKATRDEIASAFKKIINRYDEMR